jgi:transcriptional regulator with XRE-family HTH domain
MRSFAEILNDHISRAGITDAELARSVGVSRQTLFRWREGTTKQPQKRDDVLAIAAKLRLSDEERDELLLSAGFRPEQLGPGAPSPGDSELSANCGESNHATAESQQKHRDKDMRLHIGKLELLVSRRLLYLIIIVLVCAMALAALDALQNIVWNPWR